MDEHRRTSRSRVFMRGPATERVDSPPPGATSTVKAQRGGPSRCGPLGSGARQTLGSAPPSAFLPDARRQRHGVHGGARGVRRPGGGTRVQSPLCLRRVMSDQIGLFECFKEVSGKRRDMGFSQ